MNKLCKQYIKDVKSFFPIIGKEEHKYIKKLTNDVENFCEEEDNISKDDLCQTFGNPNSIASTYYASMDIELLIKRVRFSQYVKRITSILLFTAFIAASAYCTVYVVKSYYAFQEFEEDFRDAMPAYQEITIE